MFVLLVVAAAEVVVVVVVGGGGGVFGGSHQLIELATQNECPSFFASSDWACCFDPAAFFRVQRGARVLAGV